MEQRIVRKVLNIEGMTCTSCETRIENKLKKLDGIVEVKAIYSSSNVYVTYDANLTNAGNIIGVIEGLDYKVRNKPGNQQSKSIIIEKKKSDSKGTSQLIGIGVIILALYVIIQNTVGFNFIPSVNQNMGYGILFVVGLMTSLHCIAMCGGINLSQCVSYKFDSSGTKRAKMKPSLMYNTGRVISYTIIGGIAGLLGSAVSFSGGAKGIIAVASGVFMVIMGLNMLNIFPWLRKLNPRMPKIFSRIIHSNNGSRGPLVVGLLNGLMPCGPLQAMQIYALGTGSFIAGAASMFFFSIGTVPLMFGFGAISSLLSGKFTQKMLKASAVLVIILGMVMLNRGLMLSGVNTNIVYGSAPTSAGVSGVAKVDGNVQVITSKLESGSYPPIIVQKGIPVKWTITAAKSDLNGCNSKINIPEYNIQNKALIPGDNIIEFTPDKEGSYVYTCWMGMISSSIKVVPDIAAVSDKGIQQANTPSQSNSSVMGCCRPASTK